MNHMPIRKFLLAVLLASLAFSSGCAKKRPNVLIITFDTTRADHMGYATGRAGRTPVLDELARRGTWFSNDVTAQPLTVPAHTTIMTGEYPFHHGVRNNGTYIVPADDVTIAERLKERGYATHAIVSSFVLDSQFGLDQGFDTYDDDLSGGPKQQMFMFKEIPAEVTATKAVKWLKDERPKEQPFFLWLHFFDPHADYHPPRKFLDKYPGDAYSAEIAYADSQLGEVLATLEEQKLLDETLVVFTSDHGESLGEHGEKTHGIFVYDATMRVPLIMAGPGVPKGERVDSVVRSADIVPTIIDLVGLPEAGDLDGTSVAPLWKGKEDDDRTAYVECFSPRLNFGWSELRGMRSATAKVISAPRPETYDIRKDPKELRDLHPEDAWPGDSRPLFVKLGEIARSDPFENAAADQGKMDLETRRKLAALGYVWGSSEGSDGTERPDPKDRIEYWEEFQGAQALIRAKRYDEAVASIEKLLEVDSGNVIAMGSLANALARTKRIDQALAVYQRMIELDPARDTPLLASAKLLIEEKKFAEAKPFIDKVLEIQPDNPDGYTTMGDFYLDQEKYADAETWFRRALEKDPHSSLAVSGLGNCLNRAGRTRESFEVLEAGFRKDKTSQVIAYNLGVVTERLGDPKAALRYYQASLKLEPDHSMTWNNIGSILHNAGKKREAVKCFLKARESDPENAEATYNLGAVLLQAGQADKALPFLEEASAKRPDLLQAHIMLARAFAKLGEKQRAIAIWEKLVPVAPAAWLNIAKLELDLGERQKAKQALANGVAQHGDRFRTAAKKNPDLAKMLPPG